MQYLLWRHRVHDVAAYKETRLIVDRCIKEVGSSSSLQPHSTLQTSDFCDFLEPSHAREERSSKRFLVTQVALHDAEVMQFVRKCPPDLRFERVSAELLQRVVAHL